VGVLICERFGLRRILRICALLLLDHPADLLVIPGNRRAGGGGRTSTRSGQASRAILGIRRELVDEAPSPRSLRLYQHSVERLRRGTILPFLARFSLLGFGRRSGFPLVLVLMSVGIAGRYVTAIALEHQTVSASVLSIQFAHASRHAFGGGTSGVGSRI